MGLQLYINGHLIHLEPGQAIAQTKQVNDLNTLENRQAGYTNRFKIPKTAGNIKALACLTLTGNTADVPYTKNECSLYGAGGECFVYKGRAVITDAGNSYEAVIYDGIIDLYKAIENKNLSDLGLTQLTHDKNVHTIKATWTQDLDYRYIVADYNGKNGSVNVLGNRILNADYMVPSVKVSYLWNLIFSTFNFLPPLGSVFNMPDFKNLWMTFPKGISAPDNETEVFSAAATSFITRLTFSYAAFNFLSNNDVVVSGSSIRLKQQGKYRVTITGKAGSFFAGPGNDIILAKNAGGMAPFLVIPYKVIAADLPGSPTNIHFTFTDAFTPDDELTLISSHRVSWQEMPTVAITRIDSTVDFSAALSDFSIRDFVTEIVHRFGLTLFKHKYKNQYTFLTLQEQLQTGSVINWSNRFVKTTSENYMYGSYAQQNWFRYAYNDEEASHNDYAIHVANVNLQDTRDVIKSKIYSPEKQDTLIFNKPCKVYKLWEKEINTVTDEEGNETQVMTYKPLDKRYYFLRCVQDTVQNGRLRSVQMQDFVPFTHYYRESYTGLPFSDVIQQYYSPLKLLLNRALLVNAELYLTDADVAAFDFRQLVYIEQLSAYFLVNKINNYIPGRPVKCELVRLAYTSATSQLFIKMVRIAISGNTVTVFYIANMPAQNVMLQILQSGFTNWQNASGGSASPVSSYVPSGTVRVRLSAQGNFSSEATITVPANQTIEL